LQLHQLPPHFLLRAPQIDQIIDMPEGIKGQKPIAKPQQFFQHTRTIGAIAPVIAQIHDPIAKADVFGDGVMQRHQFI
jgi:hypothetical protein